MKKIALVLAVLLVVGGAAFAEVVVGGEATVSGSVTTTIGMDLDSRVWGADADSSVTLKIPFANGTAGASGDDEVYGEVSVTDLGLNWQAKDYDVDFDDTDADNPGFTDADYDGNKFTGDIAAKVVAGDIYVGLNSGGYNFNNASGTDTFDVNLDDDWYGKGFEGDLKFGYDNGTVSFGVDVAAKSGITRADTGDANEDFKTPWDGETASSDDTDSTQKDSGLVLSVNLGYASEMITFPVYLTIDPEYATDTVLFGASIDPSVMVGAFTITAPADFVKLGDEMGFDVAPTLEYALLDGITLGADAYLYNHFDTAYTANAGVNVATDGLVDGLTASVDVSLKNLSKERGEDLGWGVDVEVGYALVDGLTVNVAPGYDSTDDIDLAGSLVFDSAFTGIDNTTITLDYAKGCYDLTEGSTYETHDAGILSLSTKIAF